MRFIVIITALAVGYAPTALAESPDQVSAPETAEPTTASDWPARRAPRGQWISGLTLALAGTVSLGTAYGLHGARTNLDVVDEAALSKWNSLRYGVVGTATGGAAALVTAMPLVLPYRSKTPWWAWVSGGVGVAFLALSITTAVTADGGSQNSTRNCVDRGLVPLSDVCRERGKRTDDAVLFAMSAAPLLTMPLVYLFRKGEKKRGANLAPNLAIGRTGGSFSIRGTF